MNEWHVKMRYGSRRSVPDRLVDRWRGQAMDIIAAMEDC